jgi:predicted Zn-dependent peptidase
MYKKVILDNGISLVIETAKEARSVSVGIWVKVGSRDESFEKNGISHFLEHMFFKGTTKRTSMDIAVEIDSLGGELNAFTSRESTTFYIKVINEHIERAVELLSDIFMNSTFPEEDIEKEKRIILEEIKLVEDTPEDYIHDLFNKNIWGESGLGQPVLGRGKTIETFRRNDLLNNIREYYGTKNIVIACSGNFEEEALIGKLNLGIGAMKRDSMPYKQHCSEFKSQISIIPKKLSEVHICLGFRGLPQGSEERYSMHLLNTILGAGVSSRLFQEIREKRGLAYSIYSFNVSYFDTGVWAVYAATDRKQVSEVVNIIINQMRGLFDSLSTEDLKKAKNQLKGNLMLALESTNSKMFNIARQEIYYGKYFSPEDIIYAVEAVTLEDLKNLSQRLVGNNPFALTVYGPVKKLKLQ